MSFNSEFGFLYFPGPRASAYLKVLADLDIIPSTIILMSNGKSAEQEQYTLDYLHLAPVLTDLSEFVKKYQVNFIETDVTSINDVALKTLLDQQTLSSWLFSGGGILKPDLFQSGRKFLHVHPGVLPEEKGSTCFYYSILKKGVVGASAFWLTPELDSGSPVTYSEFTVNLAAEDCTDKMMDYWLDPYIRAQVLKKFLQLQYRQTVNYEERVAAAPRAYYVIHPILRVSALKKLISSYKSEQKHGVFEVLSEQ